MSDRQITPAELRELREFLGLSQAELSDVLGFGKNGPRSIRAWESPHALLGAGPSAPALRYLLLLRASLRALSLLEDGQDLNAQEILRAALPKEVL